MDLYGAVLVEPAVEPGMGADLVSTKEYLHSGSGQPDIHLLLDILKGKGVVHPLYRNMVIGADCCYLPCG